MRFLNKIKRTRLKITIYAIGFCSVIAIWSMKINATDVTVVCVGVIGGTIGIHGYGETTRPSGIDNPEDGEIH